MSREPGESDDDEVSSSEIDVSDDSPDDRPAQLAPVPDTKSRTIAERVYTREEKLRACVVWVTNGTVKGTAEKMGLDHEVVRRWVHSKWWPAAVAEARQKFEDEITGNLSEIINLAQVKLKERITRGDVRLNKDGDEVNVPVTARDLAVIQAIAFDKRQIISGRPTSIRGAGKSAQQRADELRGKAAPKKPEAKVENAADGTQPKPGSNVVPIKAVS